VVLLERHCQGQLTLFCFSIIICCFQDRLSLRTTPRFRICLNFLFLISNYTKKPNYWRFFSNGLIPKIQVWFFEFGGLLVSGLKIMYTVLSIFIDRLLATTEPSSYLCLLILRCLIWHVKNLRLGQLWKYLYHQQMILLN